MIYPLKVSREAFLAVSFNQHSTQNIHATLNKVYIRKLGLLSQKWEALLTEFIIPRVVVNRSNFRNLIFTCPSTKPCLTFFYLAPRWFVTNFWRLTQGNIRLCRRKSAVSQKLKGKGNFWDKLGMHKITRQISRKLIIIIIIIIIIMHFYSAISV